MPKFVIAVSIKISGMMSQKGTDNVCMALVIGICAIAACAVL